jgi:hypothetical protein
MPAATVTLQWDLRDPPLAPVAMLCRGTAASALARALFYDDVRRSKCVMVGSGDVVVTIGEDLPWVDGAIWLGRVDGLLLPTTLKPSVAPSLVLDALFRHRQRTSIAVVTPDLALVAPMPNGPPPLDVLASAAGIVASSQT